MVTINWTIVFQFVNFFILVAILAKFAYKPMLKVMEERREKIANDIANAEKVNQEAESVLAEYKAQLANAQREAQTIIEKAQRQAQDERDLRKKELHEELEREREQARKAIALERDKAMNQLHDEVVGLSILMATKVLEKNMDNEANLAMVKEAISKLDSTSVGL